MRVFRKAADGQLAGRIRDPGLRAWLLMNMRQHPQTRWLEGEPLASCCYWRENDILTVREIGWRINLDAIHSAFKKEIAVFPDLAGSVCEVWTDGLMIEYPLRYPPLIYSSFGCPEHR